MLVPQPAAVWVQDFLAAHPAGFHVMYLRKSRADLEAEARGEGETLARHRRALTELSERIGRPVAHIFEEIVSGDTISSRPEMQNVLALVESGKCAGVFVNDIDRLARGDSIGFVGRYGTGPHLNISATKDGASIDPATIIKP